MSLDAITRCLPAMPLLYTALRVHPHAYGLAHSTTRAQPRIDLAHCPTASAASTGPRAPRRHHLLPPSHVAALHGATRPPSRPRACSQLNPGSACGLTWLLALPPAPPQQDPVSPTASPVASRPRRCSTRRHAPALTPKGLLTAQPGLGPWLDWAHCPRQRRLNWALCPPTLPPVASRPRRCPTRSSAHDPTPKGSLTAQPGPGPRIDLADCPPSASPLLDLVSPDVPICQPPATTATLRGATRPPPHIQRFAQHKPGLGRRIGLEHDP